MNTASAIAQANSQDRSLAYAYSMFSPSANGEQLLYARIIINQKKASCPVLHASNNSKITTTLRPFNADQSTTNINFPVTVCEAVIAEGLEYHNTELNINLHPITLAPQKIHVYGDSGCKDLANCTGDNAPSKFATLANIGAADQPDLILHMGDYNYIGTSGSITSASTSSSKTIWAYDAGDGVPDDPNCNLLSPYYSQNAINSPRPDTWSNWKFDFFSPAKALLPTAPWVFARGNHELCSRAGPGWFYFFGPGSSLEGAVAQSSCPHQGDLTSPPAQATKSIAMIPPYRLNLQKLQLWVMDSANACDGFGENQLTKDYAAQYNTIQSSTEGTSTWLMTHRPLWGFQKKGEKSLNQMLQIALQKSTHKQLPESIALLLAGHMHVYESLTFDTSTGRAPQVVVGNSGVALSHHPKDKTFSELVEDSTAQGNALHKFGFLSVKLHSNGQWTGTMFGTNNKTLLTCDSSNPGNGNTICSLAD